MRLPETIGMLRRLDIGRRASVTMWLAVLLPGLLIMIAMGVEIAGWEAAQVSVQRAADVSALAGSINYQSSHSPQTAATFAARFAQLNGGAGTASPNWDATAKTLTDNQITVQYLSAGPASGNPALLVTFHKTVPATLSTAFSSVASYTVTGRSTSELVSSTSTASGGAGGSGGQPCLLALAGNTGITSTTNITVNGSVTLTASGCTIRSNAGMLVNGSNTITAQAIYTGGAFTNNGSSSITGTRYQNQGQIPDPYAGDSTLQNALTSANSATGTGTITCNGSATCTGPTGSYSCSSGVCTIQPGTYSGMTINGSMTVHLNPGRYVFTGSVAVNGSSSVTAANVTLLLAAGTGNTLTVNGSSTFAASAATTTGAINDQIPGIVFASLSTGGSTFNGSSTSPDLGVAYYPNGTLTINGSDTNGSPSCFQVIAKTIVLNGSPSFDVSTCASYGTATFGSVPSTLVARVVH